MSSREDRGRYRGRRRAPTPPRIRCAAVATTAFIGASIVALGTAAAMPDKADPGTLNANNAANISGALAGRQANADRANRSLDRGTALSNVDQVAPDLWLLPLKDYTLATPFGQHAGTLHQGVDLAVSEGTAYYAAHSGTVKLARWYGGFGYCVMIDAGNGVTLVYGHSSQLLVHEGQTVQAGDVLGLTGATGYAFGPNLYFEVEQGGTPIDPVQFMQAHGVDILKKTQAIDN